MNEVLPYVANRETFISHIKFYMKETLCRQLDFDCWVHDFMAVSRDECILTDEGYETIKTKYSEEIDTFILEMTQQHEQEQLDEEKRYQVYVNGNEDQAYMPEPSETDELPFR